MERRTKSRVDLQLTCCIEAGKAEATPVRALTENVSRTGMLMRWSGTAPVPKVDGRLTLDVLLPENSEFGPRVMRCRTEVTRVIRREEGEHEVALRVITMRFIKPGADVENTGLAQADPGGSGVTLERRRTERRRDSSAAPTRKQNRKTRDLASMPVATEHIS